MKEPLIIKSTFYNISPKDLEELRQNIKRQMQEENPVVVLPCGFEIANVNTELLKQIKDEIADLDDADYDYEGYYKAVTDAVQIIDNHIKKMKGE